MLILPPWRLVDGSWRRRLVEFADRIDGSHAGIAVVRLENVHEPVSDHILRDVEARA